MGRPRGGGQVLSIVFLWILNQAAKRTIGPKRVLGAEKFHGKCGKWGQGHRPLTSFTGLYTSLPLTEGKTGKWEQERPSQVATFSGWESQRARFSQPPAVSLGVQPATAMFKRRQAIQSEEAKWRAGQELCVKSVNNDFGESCMR